MHVRGEIRCGGRLQGSRGALSCGNPVKMMVGGRIKWYTMALAVQALVRQYRYKDPASSLP